MVSQISFSLSGSTLEVASSKIMYSAFDKRALAIPIFWRCRRRGKHLHFQHQNSVLFPVTVQILKVPLLLQPPLKSGHLHPGSARSRFSRMVPEKRFTCWEPWQCAFSVPPASCCDSLCRPCKYVRLPRHKNALKEKQWWIFHSRKVQLKRQQNLWGL